MKACRYVDYSGPIVVKCNLGKEFHYRDERGKLSLPCPCCSFDGFSIFFDIYDHVIKLSLLTQGKKEVKRLNRYLSRGMIGYILKVKIVKD